MKKLTLFMYFMFSFIQPVFAYESITSNIKSVLKHSTGTSYFSVVIALGIVIVLIYITGIIYAKLNVVGYNTLKKQYIDINDSKLIILSSTQVGKDKSLLVVELSGKKMLLGVTDDAITLIKDLDEDKNNTENKVLSKEVLDNPNLERIYPTGKFMEDDVEIKQNIPDEDEEQEKSVYDSEEFGLYKKYLDK